MNHYLQIAVLAVIQGAAELLPVSSSAHVIVAEKLMIQGFHYPFPGLGHLEKDGAGYRVVPAAWNPVL